MFDEAVRNASRRTGVWIVLGMALVIAAAAAPAAAAVPAAWGATASAALPCARGAGAPVVLQSGPCPASPEDRLTSEEAALPSGPGNAGGAPWRLSMEAEPRRAPIEGPGTVARVASSRSPVLPGDPLEGVLHGLSPPDVRPHA